MGEVSELELDLMQQSTARLQRIHELETELADYKAYVAQIERWAVRGNELADRGSVGFHLGHWWADRPWRKDRPSLPGSGQEP